MYYASSTGGFYDTAIHVRGSIPADAVEITADDHAALLAGQSAGKRIVPDADGRPVLADPPAPSVEELAAQLRAERDAALTACEWLVIRHRDQTDAGSATTLTAAQYAELLTYRQALRDWPTVTGWPNADLPAKPAWLAGELGGTAATDEP